MREAAELGLFSQKTAETIQKTRELSTPTADGLGAGREESALFACAKDRQLAGTIAQAVFGRAAKHIACTLAAILRFCEFDPARRVTVSADGSVFRKSVLFRPALESYVQRYTDGYQIQFAEMEHSTIIGTAIGALMN